MAFQSLSLAAILIATAGCWVAVAAEFEGAAAQQWAETQRIVDGDRPQDAIPILERLAVQYHAADAQGLHVLMRLQLACYKSGRQAEADKITDQIVNRFPGHPETEIYVTTAIRKEKNAVIKARLVESYLRDFPTGAHRAEIAALQPGASVLPPGADGAASKSSPMTDAGGKELAAAQGALKSRQFAAARKLFDDFIDKHTMADPHLPEALLGRGICEMNLPAHESAAITTWNSLLLRHGATAAAAEALEQLALYYAKKGQGTKVTEMEEKLVAVFPSHPATVRVCARKADALFRAKKFAEAVKILEKIEPSLDEAGLSKLSVARGLAGAGSDPRKLLNEANRQIEANEGETATMLYQLYLREHPKGAGIGEAKCRLGWCFYTSKKIENKKADYDQAEKLWKEVIAQGPAKDRWVGESQWHLVQLLAGPRGKWEEAVKLCDLLSKTFPGEFRQEQALFSKAWLFCAHQQWAASRAAFEELIKVFPNKAKHPPIVEYLEKCDKNLAVGKKGSS